jgi:two-component system, LuxR family, response regulator FixJ
MPEMTGPELQSELLKRGVHIPTIVITAVQDERVAERTAALGAAAFLTKPLTGEALIAAINSAVERRN